MQISSVPSIASTANIELHAKLTHDINFKTKPLGSLGRLEQLALQIGLIQQTHRPKLAQPAMLVFAGDHGVVAENISAYPQSVTWQMVENFLAKGAAINVFADQQGMQLIVVDAGVNHDFGSREQLVNRKVAYATQNFAHAKAMSDDQCALAVQHGVNLVANLPGNVLGFGEMGIGNTTSAAAIMHCLTGVPVAQCVGAGTGLDSAGVQRKQHVIEAAVAFHAQPKSPLEVLACFGGFEIAMMVGAMLAAAERRMVLLIDGFIVTSALLVAARLQPNILDYCVFAHCSEEQGHKAMLQNLDAQPLLNLGLRLGEGTGCALAYPLLLSAVKFLAEMATFESAQVSEKID